MGGARGCGIFRYADNIDKLLMFLGSLGCIGDGLMIALNMYILSGIIDDFGSAGISISNEVVDKYSLRLLYVAIGVGVSAFIEGVCWTVTAERQTSRMRKEYLKSVLRQEVSFFDNQDASCSTFQVVSTISADAHVIQDVIAEKIPNTLANLCTFISGFIVAAILSWRLAVAAIPFQLGFMVPGVAFGKLLMKSGMEMRGAYGVAGSIAEQAISSIRTVYSYVAEIQTVKRFSSALEESKNLGIKQGFVKGNLIGSMGMVYVAWAFESWIGSVFVADKGESGGRVFISAVCINLGGLSCMGVLPNFSFITEARVAAAKIFELINRVPEIDSEDGKGKALSYVRGEIEFRDVSFRYPSRPDITVLENFSLRVKAGKTMGVIGLVNQEPVLFATSIKENILFGNEKASMEDVIDAAKAANAHSFIEKLPLGYETHVGQFGFQLSGGQKQRIAIARALLKDPKILLLDEATSALDAQSERVVQEALDQASEGRTTIVIAHRLSTIRKADKIVVLQSGRIVESGSHHQLMQKNEEGGGVYFKMVQLQQSAEETETEAPSHSYHHPNDSRNSRRGIHMNTPNSPYSARSSGLNTPASPFVSPSVISPSIVPSVHLYSYCDSDDDTEDISEKLYQKSPSMWRLLKLNGPEWKRALLGCLGAFAFGAVQPAHAYCLGTVVSVYVSNSSNIKSETKDYSIAFLCFGVITYFTSIIQHYNFAFMGEMLTKRVREKMLQSLLTFEVGWYDEDENTSAAISARLASEANMVRALVGDRISLLLQISTSASLAFLLGLIVTWKVAIVLIAIQPLAVMSFYSRSVLMKSMSRRAKKAQSEGSQLASEAVINHRTITAFSSQQRIMKLFMETQRGPRKESLRQSWVSGAGLFCSQFITTANIAITFWYGGRLMNKGEVSAKHLFQAFFILLSTGKNIADAGSMTSDLARGSSAVASVLGILDRKSEIEPDDNLQGLEVKNPLRGKIELKSVFFSYPSRPDQMVFQGMNLKIEPGRTMALVGQSGSGKSTIIGLIERFYDPTRGSVLIDDRDIKAYNLRSLRSHIALVSQEPTLFAGTIQENITYGKENATQSEIKKAAILANAHEFISSMKDGYETYCGERGVQLSGGQKQRIALARAILKNPAILLLDEATSALDSVSENLVQEALEKMMNGRTCVIVAHRLSTIQKSDTISVIKNGKVVEQGSHSDLLRLGTHGSYYSLIKLQYGQSPPIRP
nr:putative multidrug resistance protein [Ipomoea batatas]